MPDENTRLLQKEEIAEQLDMGSLLMSTIHRIRNAITEDPYKYKSLVEFFHTLVWEESKNRTITPKKDLDLMTKYRCEEYGLDIEKEYEFEMFFFNYYQVLERAIGTAENRKAELYSEYYDLMFRELFKIIRKKIPEKVNVRMD